MDFFFQIQQKLLEQRNQEHEAQKGEIFGKISIICQKTMTDYDRNGLNRNKI